MIEITIHLVYGKLIQRFNTLFEANALVEQYIGYEFDINLITGDDL